VETNEIVVLVVVVLVVLAIVAALMAAQKKRRSEQLRSTFGPEYDRTLEGSGRRRDAERDLAARAEHRSSLDIRPLSASDRQAFAARWTATQADFVDRPAEAVRAADVLVSEVMRQRGYPVGDFDQQARDVSVDHAEVVHEYRAAHDISLLNDRQQATTEQLRQAMVHYRALFTELLGDDDVAQAGPPVYPTDERTGSGRDLPAHDLSDRDVAYLDRTDRETVDGGTSYQDSTRQDLTRRDEAPREPTGRDLDDRDATLSDGSEHRQAQERFAANHDGSYDGARGGTSSTGATDPGYATDEDRRRREGGLLASGDHEQPQVVHVRRERLDDETSDRGDRDRPSLG
jgi:hypothetical protein